MSHKLEQVIGRDAMRKLVAEYGGQQLYVPRMIHLDAGDVARIRELRAANVPVNDLARQFGVTAKRIYLALKGP